MTSKSDEFSKSPSGPSTSTRSQKIGSGIRRGGRKLASEWAYVNINEDEAFCVFCKKKVSNKIKRIREHLKVCDNKHRREFLR